MLRFRSGDELFNAAEFFQSQPLPQGRRVGIVSNSASVATVAADACATRGLVVSQAGSEAANPLILGIRAGTDEYAAAVRAALADPAVDAVEVHYVDLRGSDAEGVLEAVSRAAQNQGKPVLASIVRADGGVPTSRRDAVPNFRFPESCAGVLARAVERTEWLLRPLGQHPTFPDLDPAAAQEMVAGWLAGNALHSGRSLGGAADVDAAVAAAREIGAPVALKAHLTPPAIAADIDAVLLGLEGEEAVRAGWRELERRVRSAGQPFRGVLVQPLVEPGADVLVGSVNDPDLGPVLALGLGGRQAGLAQSVAYRLLPTTGVEADELINASRGVLAQLEGFRGGARLDRLALTELILRFALLLREVPEVTEADLNPVRVMTTGCRVLDMRLRIAPRLRPELVKTW